MDNQTNQTLSAMRATLPPSQAEIDELIKTIDGTKAALQAFHKYHNDPRVSGTTVTRHGGAHAIAALARLAARAGAPKHSRLTDQNKADIIRLAACGLSFKDAAEIGFFSSTYVPFIIKEWAAKNAELARQLYGESIELVNSNGVVTVYDMSMGESLTGHIREPQYGHLKPMYNVIKRDVGRKRRAGWVRSRAAAAISGVDKPLVVVETGSTVDVTLSMAATKAVREAARGSGLSVGDVVNASFVRFLSDDSIRPLWTRSLREKANGEPVQPVSISGKTGFWGRLFGRQ